VPPALLLLLVAGAAAWTAAVIAAPGAPVSIASGIYAAASVVCHQIPSRSFALAGGPIAVCARCLGLYLGGLAGFALAAALHRKVGRVSRPLAVVAAASVPTALTVLLEWGTHAHVTNALRFGAALPLGAAVALVIGAAVSADARQVR
jgi:uncharacterized membrane protein